MKNSTLVCSTLFAASCSLSVLALAPDADAANIQVFKNKAEWIAALKDPWFETEDFNDQTLLPGLSVDSTVGNIAGGVWNDVIDGNPLKTTTWSFNQPEIWDGIYAWGGNWNLDVPGGPGTGIAITVDFLMNGEKLVQEEIPNNLRGGFWGIVSDMAFDEVMLTQGSMSGVQETYTLDDMVYAPQKSPEPGSMLGLLAFGVLGVGTALKRKQK